MKSIRQFLFSTFHKDPYEILGVTPRATMEEIRNAYIDLSKKSIDHPDVNQSQDTTERFKQIHQAYNHLKQIKFEEKMQEEFRQQYYASQTEEELFRQIFGFYFHEQPLEYYKPENQQKREMYQELLKKYKINKGTSQQQQNINLKVNRLYKDNNEYSNVDTTSHKYVLLMGVLAFSGLALYLVFIRKAPELQKQVIQQQTLDKLRNKTMERHQQYVDNVKNMYSGINDRMLKFDPLSKTIDLLMKYTIYEDLDFYYVSRDLFFDDEKYYFRNSDFEKTPIKQNKIHYRISQALEAERCLQSIFVPVNEVLKQIEEKGYYEPPGIFMQFCGYIYFKIRDNKPIRVQGLEEAKQFVSLFDLYFQYYSPIPYYYYEYDEIQVFTEHPSSNFSATHFWEGNVVIDTRDMPKFYLRGNVQNIFVHRPKQQDFGQYMYYQGWGSYYQHLGNN